MTWFSSCQLQTTTWCQWLHLHASFRRMSSSGH